MISRGVSGGPADLAAYNRVGLKPLLTTFNEFYSLGKRRVISRGVSGGPADLAGYNRVGLKPFLTTFT